MSNYDRNIPKGIAYAIAWIVATFGLVGSFAESGIIEGQRWYWQTAWGIGSLAVMIGWFVLGHLAISRLTGLNPCKDTPQ